jgi:3-oxoacyl-[acyl-carrier-protein] synthase-3
MIRAGQSERLLLIGAETLTRLLDWSDRSTCVLFGDGAGAVVIEAGEGQGTNADRGILATKVHADGQHRDLLCTDGGPGSTGETGKLRMQGREVFRHAVTRIAEVMEEVMREAGVTARDIDLFVPHQANIRILDATAKKAGIPPEKIMLTVAGHGNTSAASIPLALDAAVRQGRAKPGDLLLLEAMGGGFTWGGALVRL